MVVNQRLRNGPVGVDDKKRGYGKAADGADRTDLKGRRKEDRVVAGLTEQDNNNKNSNTTDNNNNTVNNTINNDPHRFMGTTMLTVKSDDDGISSSHGVGDHRSTDQMAIDLGPGPLRFGPAIYERTYERQMESLTRYQYHCVQNLRRKWEEKNPDLPFDDEMYLRFARASPGSRKPFNVKAARKAMLAFDHHYLSLTAEGMEPLLQSKTLFPVPGLKSKEGGRDMFYMRPSRYFPKETPTEEIIDNLAYVLLHMTSISEHAATNGIGFIANMDDWKMVNFNVSYCYQFMKMLQGSVPVRVELFLIVNPPSWFGNIWKIMKRMLSYSFRRKVHMIPEEKLSKYLMNGYEDFLPDDVSTGYADTDSMVKDFIAYRKYIE